MTATMQKPDNERPDQAEIMRAFEQAEAKLRLEGMQPYPIFFELRDRLLTGEVGLDEAVMILNANYPSNPPGIEEWDDLHRVNPSLYYVFMESLDPKLRGLFDTDPEAYYKGLGQLETAENYVELMRLYNSKEAAARFRALAGAVPEIEDRTQPAETDLELKEDLDIAQKVMSECREALRELAGGSDEPKQSEASWDEILAELDASPVPDDFLSESERDKRPPQARPAIDELFDDDAESDQ